MRTEQYLGQLTSIRHKISAKRRDAAMWREMASGLGGDSGNADRVQSSTCQDLMAEAIAKAVDCENESLELIKQLMSLQQKIIGEIDRLPMPDHSLILSEYYVHGMSVSQIAREWDKSYRHIKRIKSEAVHEFTKVFGDNH